MPVDAFRLENFMAFEDTGWIELRKINLLLGRNSSGKSAIIRALRLMKQSWENQRESGESLTFRVEGGVDVGSFDTMRHRKPNPKQHDLDIESEESKQQAKKPNQQVVEDELWAREQVTFSYRGRLTQSEFEEIAWPLFFAQKRKGEIGALPEDFAKWKDTAWPVLQTLMQQFVPDSSGQLIFHLTASHKTHKTSKQSYVWKFDLGVCQSLLAEDFASVIGFEILDENWDSFDVYEYLNSAPGLALSVDRVFKAESYFYFLPELNIPSDLFKPDEKDTLGIVNIFGQICLQLISAWLESIVHIGPIRPLPKRTYHLTEEYERELKLGGWQSFLNYLRTSTKDLEGKINHWLDKLNLGKRIDRIGIGFNPDVYDSVRLRIDETGDEAWRELTDVGFGASQILPVIVQCQAANEDALVLIEQPELHLHPEAQADVADMFIESVNAMRGFRSELHPRQFKAGEKWMRLAQQEEKPEPVNRRYLVETHSETIFLRFRVEIARNGGGKETKYPLSEADFICYHVERNINEGVSNIDSLLFDNRAEFTKRHERFFDFFGQDFKETIELRKARS